MFLTYQQMIKHTNDDIMNRWYVYDASTCIPMVGMFFYQLLTYIILFNLYSIN